MALYVVRYNTVVNTRIIKWNWPPNMIRANAELDQVEANFQA